MWDKLIPHSSEPRRVRLLSHARVTEGDIIFYSFRERTMRFFCVRAFLFAIHIVIHEIKITFHQITPGASFIPSAPAHARETGFLINDMNLFGTSSFL